MANQLQLKGAQSPKPTRYGVLWNNRFATGIWTNRNPLRDAASSRLEEAFYGSRGDSVIAGTNVEVSAGLTFIRRPGTTVYNSQTFPAVNRFYEFHQFNSDTEKISVIADTASAIYDCTGPNTKTLLYTKSAGAGSTYFQSVGNTLYFSDGVDSEKLVASLLSWGATKTFTSGQFIVDTNGNIQEAVGAQTVNVTNIQVVATTSGGIHGHTVTVFFSPTTPLSAPDSTVLTLSGLTTVPALNGATPGDTVFANSYQVSFFTITALTPTSYTTETGTATTGNGTTGSSQPSWNVNLGGITQDSGAQWVNRGSQVEKWGISSPTVAPTVTQNAAPSIYPNWVASTWYAPLFVISDSNGNLQQLTTGGTTGGSAPTWATVKGNTTTDNTAVWTCLGAGTWGATTAYAVGDVIKVTYTFYITYTSYEYQNGQYVPVQKQQAVTETNLFQCSTAGTSGSSEPSWASGLGTTTTDGTVIWTNLGTPQNWPGATQALSTATKILDSNYNIQTVQTFGESGTTAPTWKTAQGDTTPDNNTSWLNSGPFAAANTGAWTYAYSYGNSITGHVSTASPSSSPVTVALGKQAVIQGSGSSDPQIDEIYLWRTTQGGGLLLYLDKITNPGNGQWVYTDTTSDLGLNSLIEAPIDNSNDPPPTGLSALTYHLGRVWGAVNNSVYFSTGPDVSIGNGSESWNPANVFVFPSSVRRLFPTTSGLLVFTVSDIYIIAGLGTSASPFFSAPFLKNIGLVSYDAFAVNGQIVYIYTSDNELISLDPSSGISNLGFPIGDQFGPGNGSGTFTPASTRVTWYIGGSQDTALFVSDSTGNWWRMSPTPAPETGITWSPMASLTGGFSCVQSVETSPGVHSLLIAPATSGTIQQRSYTTFADNGSAYEANLVLGSLVLAQPGQIAAVESVTTDAVATGTQITLAVQLDEIGQGASAAFESLTSSVNDPTQLAASTTVYAQRFYLSQTQQPAWCRHMQIKVDFGSTDTVRNELLSLTVYGGFEQEK